MHNTLHCLNSFLSVNKLHICQVSRAGTPLLHQRFSGSHMSVALPELCNGTACLKCVTLKGKTICAEKAQASGTTYLNFQELTPDYEEDIKRRFATTPPSVVTQSPTTALTPSSTTPQVFRVEGFPGFSDLVTAPPQEVLLWSVEDSNVTQEYVVDLTTGQVFEKAPIYKNLASTNHDPSKSPNDLSSALSSPDDHSQDVSERDSLLTTFPSESRPDSSSSLRPSHPSESSPTSDPEDQQIPIEARVTEVIGTPNITNVETEVVEVIGTPDNVDIAEDTTIPVVEETTEAAVTEPTTDPEITNVTNVAESASSPEVTEATETTEVNKVTDVAKVDQFSNNSTQTPHPASNTETTSGSANSTSPTTSQTPKPSPTSEGSGLNHRDLNLDSSIQIDNTTTAHTTNKTVAPNKYPIPSNTPTNESSGGFLSGLLGAAGSVVSGVLSVKDSLINTATSGVSAGISGIIQGTSSLGTLAKAKTGKSGKKKSRPKTQSKPNQTNNSLGQSRVISTTSSTTKRTPRQTTKHATGRPKQSQKTTPVSRKSVISGSKNATKTKTVSSAKQKPTAKPTAKPSWKENTPPASASTRKPPTSGNSRSDWISRGLDQIGGLDQITDAFSSLAEQKVKDTLLPQDPFPTSNTYPDYPDYLNYEGVDSSGFSQGEGEGPWDYPESLVSDKSQSRNQVQPSPPNATPRIFHKSERFPPNRMPQGKPGSKPGGATPGTKRCGQKVGCSEWGQFKEDTLMPFIQLLTNSNGQGLDMFPDDDSGSQLFSKEGLDSFSKDLDSHSAGAPLKLNTGIRMLLKFSLATLAQTRMARINSQDQSELSRWTDLGLTLPGLFLGLFYFLYLVRQLHTQWKANAVQKERRRELDRDARMLKNLQASRRRPAHDRALEMPLRNRRDYDVEAQPDYE